MKLLRASLLLALLLCAMPAWGQVALTVQDEETLSAPPTLIAADAAGHTFDNARSDVVLWIRNSSTSSRTLTVQTERVGSIGPVPNYTMTIPAGSYIKTPAFDARRFTDPATGLATCSFSSVVDVEIAAVRRHTVFRE